MKPFNEHNPQSGFALPPGTYGLHGDVIVESHASAPEGFADMPEIKDACLAYGEATGHAHKIIGGPGDFELRECPKTKVRHLHVVREVMLKHQEHEPRGLPPGHYRIGIQREYSPFDKRVRQVID